MRRLSRSDSYKSGTRFGHVAAGTLGTTMLLGALLLGLATTIPVAHAQKPVPPPPVYYDVLPLGEGSPWEMNDAGIMVGHSLTLKHAYKFDWLTGSVDLNVGATWIDLEVGNPPPTGWTAVMASDINNHGEIVGVAQQAITGVIRAYHFDGTSAFKLLPGPTFANVNTLKVKINDVGTICAADGNVNVIVYSPDLTTYSYTFVATPIVASVVDVNNIGVIVATNNAQDPTSVRIVLGVSGYTTFPHCALRHINDFFICGVRAASGKVKGAPIRVGVDQSPSQVLALASTNTPMSTWAGGVNNNGDVVINQSLVLYKDGVSLKINDLIAPGNSRAIWTSLTNVSPCGISERVAISPTEGFGCIGLGGNYGGTFSAIILIPRKP